MPNDIRGTYRDNGSYVLKIIYQDERRGVFTGSVTVGINSSSIEGHYYFDLAVGLTNFSYSFNNESVMLSARFVEQEVNTDVMSGIRTLVSVEGSYRSDSITLNKIA